MLSIKIRSEHIPHFMRLLRDCEEAQDRSLQGISALHLMRAVLTGEPPPESVIAVLPAQHRLWSWVEEHYPEARGVCCSIDLDNPLCPAIKVCGEKSLPPNVPGQIKLSSEQTEKFLEAIEAVPAGTTSKSYLAHAAWSVLADWYPQVHHGDWVIQGSNSAGIYLVPAEPQAEPN